MKVKVQPEEEIKYQIESDYGWLECTYYPNRAIEHFSSLFSHYAQHMVEPNWIDNSTKYSLYMNYATDLLERFTKQEFERALRNLVLKIEVQTLIAVENIEPKEATKRINKLADSIKKEAKRDMNAPKRGGARKERERQYFTSNAEFLNYAETVNSLRPLWTYATHYFKQRYYDENCRIRI